MITLHYHFRLFFHVETIIERLLVDYIRYIIFSASFSRCFAVAIDYRSRIIYDFIVASMR